MKLKLSTLLMIVMIFWLTGCTRATDGAATPIPSSQEPAMTPVPFPGDTVVLARHREGGIAGFCDDVTIQVDGTFRVTYCTNKGPESSGKLNADQLAQLTTWVNTFKSFEAGADDDLTSFPDQMIVKTTFKGIGQTQASPVEVIAISEFAASLVTQPLPTAAIKARDFLADKLGLSADKIKIVRAEAVEWPDSCLGQGQADETCAQVITPGYKVTLEAGGSLYLLHTDQTGENIRQS